MGIEVSTAMKTANVRASKLTSSMAAVRASATIAIARAKYAQMDRFAGAVGAVCAYWYPRCRPK